MKLAYIVFEGITWLDFVGFYDPISRLVSLNYLPDLSWDICVFSNSVPDPSPIFIGDPFGLQMAATRIKPSLADYDAIFIPGGFTTRQLRLNPSFIGWIKTAAPVTHKISVCTGSLILGAAGLLTGKKATTHYQEDETLRPYCSKVIAERIVEDGDTITAGAVSSSIDLGLYMCEKWAGTEAREEIRKRMDYHG